jgi:hypothetical protein
MDRTCFSWVVSLKEGRDYKAKGIDLLIHRQGYSLSRNCKTAISAAPGWALLGGNAEQKLLCSVAVVAHHGHHKGGPR